MKELAVSDSNLTIELLPYIPYFGRWDYLYWFVGTPVERPSNNAVGSGSCICVKRKENLFSF